eukprot:TRINITY_DN9356_c0_g1_i1.p1 TRINITY_DN9356_c0_g1~~TRINITY_DN9356_c0_g1_i1.p1  ORF type:complete len:101 (-),score=14.17 TRINITY_DN9356_c0_g1_i1:23-289(-)
MALVGYRKVGDKVFYLLQNWWKKKQFVEVDEEYLENSFANVYFVETPQTEIPSNLPTQTGKYFELKIDRPENLLEKLKPTGSYQTIAH